MSIWSLHDLALSPSLGEWSSSLGENSDNLNLEAQFYSEDVLL